MKTCEYDGAPFTEPRSHPWTDATSSPEYRYYDLKANPAAIRTSLEDFVPFRHYAAIEDIYALLEWLNSEASPLESNDSAFTGPHPNETPAFAKALQCSGRIMVLYRALAENVAPHRIESLANTLHHRWGASDRDFAWGMIGTTVVPVRYVTLPEHQQLGHELMISFWAWGRSEAELMINLRRVVKTLSKGLTHPSPVSS